MFKDNHIVNTIPDNPDRYYVAIDYGTQNPCVFLLIAVKGDKHYIVKEYYYDGRARQRQKTDDEYANDLIAFVKGYKISGIAVDPSAASFIAAIKKKNLSVTPAKNAVLDGIRDTAGFIAGNLLFVHESCLNTIKEFGAYSWDNKAARNGEDKPIKEYDHALDALRYYISTFCVTKRLGSVDRNLFGF